MPNQSPSLQFLRTRVRLEDGFPVFLPDKGRMLLEGHVSRSLLGIAQRVTFGIQIREWMKGDFRDGRK